VRRLCEVSTVLLNKFSSTGSTALLAAIRQGDETMTCFLLSNLRVDPNKGFYCTPLQLAVQLGKEKCCRLLLGRSSTAPNGTVGSLPCPLQIAVEFEHIEIAQMLLADPRIIVPNSIIDYLETQNKVHLLQLLIAAGHFRIGRLWGIRTAILFCAAFLLFMIFCFDMFFVVLAAGSIGGVAVLSIHCCSGMIALLYLKKTSAFNAKKLLPIVVPFFPVLEILTFTCFVFNLAQSKPDLSLREQHFAIFEHCIKARMLFSTAPLLATRLVTMNDFSGRSFAASLFSTFVYCGFVCTVLGVRSVRAVSPRRQYTILEELSGSPC
jgi:hypothetical protein